VGNFATGADKGGTVYRLHREEADQGQDLAEGAQSAGDHQMRDGQEPLHEGAPPGDAPLGLELELQGVGSGHRHDGSSEVWAYGESG
jgi:hypothetical protein